MLKAQIKKEIAITNKELAQYLWEDGSIFDNIEETISNMLYNRYKMNYDERCNAVAELTDMDYVEMLIFLANKLQNK